MTFGRVRNEQGEVASWLILGAALAMIAMAAGSIVSPIITNLAYGVGGGAVVAPGSAEDAPGAADDGTSTAGSTSDTDTSGTSTTSSGGDTSSGDTSTPPGGTSSGDTSSGDTSTPPGDTGGSTTGSPDGPPSNDLGDGSPYLPIGDGPARLDEITELIDKGDDLGISEGELDDIQDILASLTVGELEYVFANMTDEQLERLFHNVHSSGFWSNDWNDSEREAFYDVLLQLGKEGSLETWLRIGEFSPRIDPDPRLALPDTANADAARAEYFENLEWELLTAPAYDPDKPIDFTTIRQGQIGDCYLIAGLILLAEEDPNIVQDMIDLNDNGTYTITFGDGHEEVVTPTQVVDEFGNPAFATTTDGLAWAALIEKGYAQRYGGWGTNPGITGGQVSSAIEALTGRESSWTKSEDLNFDQLADQFEAGDNLALSTIDAPDQDRDKVEEWKNDPDTPDTFSQGEGTFDRLHQNHAFVILDVDRDNETISVLNPWNPSKPPLELSFDELVESVNGVYANDAS